jgi:hypothetical protein
MVLRLQESEHPKAGSEEQRQRGGEPEAAPAGGDPLAEHRHPAETDHQRPEGEDGAVRERAVDESEEQDGEKAADHAAVPGEGGTAHTSSTVTSIRLSTSSRTSSAGQ